VSTGCRCCLSPAERKRVSYPAAATGMFTGYRPCLKAPQQNSTTGQAVHQCIDHVVTVVASTTDKCKQLSHGVISTVMNLQCQLMCKAAPTARPGQVLLGAAVSTLPGQQCCGVTCSCCTCDCDYDGVLHAARVHLAGMAHAVQNGCGHCASAAAQSILAWQASATLYGKSRCTIQSFVLLCSAGCM
jgi:hypothetical protein